MESRLENAREQSTTNCAAPVAPGGRLPWVDALKGIGILAVVAGHVDFGATSEFVYLFHMPLFFVIGGYLLRPNPNLRAFALRKARHLLVPYACYIAAFYPLQIALERADHLHRPLRHLIAAPFLGGEMLNGPTTAFWFITCLFLTQQVVNFLVVRIPRPSLIFLILCASLVLAFADALLLHHWVPWSANVVLAAAPLFYLGYQARLHAARPPLWIALALACLSLALYATGWLGVPDMRATLYGTPVLALVFSLAWIALLAALSKRLVAIPLVGATLEELGGASMTILYVHTPLIIGIESGLGIHSQTACFTGTVLGSCILHRILRSFRAGRVLFLGVAD